jgi:hypothetical protein
MGRRIRYRPGGSEEQFASVGRAQKEPFWTPKTIITIAVVWMLVLVGIVLGGYFIMQNRKFQSEFAPLVDVCRGKWVNAASTYSLTPGNHPAVAVKSNSSGWELDGYLIRGEVLAQSLAETQLVLCLGAVQEVFIESCPYVDQNDPGGRVTNTVERYYYKQDAQLIEAKTGRVVTVQTFTGKSPHYCDKSQVFIGDDKILKLTGTEISGDEVQRWLRSHLIIN